MAKPSSVRAIGDTVQCYPLIVSKPHTVDTYTKAPYQATATARFVVEKCVAPTEPIFPDEIIDINITYKWCDIIIHDPHNEISRWPSFNPDGAEVWSLINLPPLNFKRFLYIWRLTEISLYLNDLKVKTIKRNNADPGDEFNWTFHGTIEELLGREIEDTETNVTLNWEISYKVVAGVNVEWWPWDAPVIIYEDEYISEILLSRTIYIKVPVPPPPPYPVFNLDLCSVSKTTVAPNEKFNIKVTIENQSETSGNYRIGYYCEGNYGGLATGTIGGYAARSHTFSVTANQLAQCSIAESQMLAFTIVDFNDEDETDRWTPAAIFVIVEVPPEKANLSGRVSGKGTELALAGVSVSTTGRSTSTNSYGRYTLEGLDPGTYTIEFTKVGYWDVTKSKRLFVGENTLNVEMAPTSEPQPSKTPLILMGAGALGIMALLLIRPKVKGGREK